MLQAVSAPGYVAQSGRRGDIPDTDLVEIKAELVTAGRNDQEIETAAGRLGLEPSVSAIRWHAAEQNGQPE